MASFNSKVASTKPNISTMGKMESMQALDSLFSNPEHKKALLKDLVASLVVFLVALPLCMGIAIACGVPPALGIITGIIGGVIVGPLSGCPLQVSGPAAGLIVVVSDLLRDLGPEKLGVVVLIAGILQIVGGVFRVAQWFRAVTPEIINGMLAGIGILIFASQFHIMVDDSPKGSGLNNLLSIPGAIWKGFTPNSVTSHDEAAALGVATIAILVLWDKLAPKRLKILPGSLIAVVTATATAAIFSLPVRYVSLPDSLWQSISYPTVNGFLSSIANKEVVLGGLAIALIAAIETLLSAQAVDKMQRGSRTNYDRELTAQGIGNMFCGFLGALPITGVIVRSGVNVNAGAKTRLSSTLHGVWLMMFVLLLPFIVKLIPTATLAALLVFTGYKLADFRIVIELRKFGKGEVLIYLVTVICIVAVDLLTGVLVGVALSIGKLLYTFSHLQIKTVDDPKKNTTILWLSGAATFLNLPRLAQALEKVRPDTELHIHLEALDYIDHASLDLLMTWDKQHQSTGGSVVIDWSTLGAVFRDRRKRSRPGPTKEFRKSLEELSRSPTDPLYIQNAQEETADKP